MSLEENKALVRRAYLEGLNKNQLSILDEVFAPDYLVHYPGMEPIAGRDTAKVMLREFLDAFPDIVFTIEDQIAEGNKVVTRWSAHGTHLGAFSGFPSKTNVVQPTGRHVTFSATDIYLIQDGMVKVEWNTLEQLDVMQQLGLVPTPQ